MAEANLAVIITGHGKDLINEFQKIGSAADKAGNKTKSGWDKAKQGMQVAGAAIAGTAIAIGVSSIHSADDFELAHARLQAAVRATKGSFDAFAPAIDKADAKMRSLGFKDGETESSLATLTAATHSTKKALGDMGLAADLARGRNIDLSTATSIIAKVETGHVALLGKLGIATKDATGKTISQHEAMKRLATMFGGQAKGAVDTFAGKQKVLKAEMDHLQVKIGQALIPVLETLATVLGKVIDWFEKHKAVAIALAAIVGGVVVAATVAWTVALFTAGGALAFLLSPITLVVLGVAALAIGVIYAYKHFKIFRTTIDLIWTGLKFVFNWVKQHWPLILAILAGPIGLAVLMIARHWDTLRNGVVTAFNAIKRIITTIWNATWNAVATIIRTEVNIVHGIASGFWAAIVRVFNSIKSTVSRIWSDMWNGIKSVVSGAASAVMSFLQPIIDALNTIITIAGDVASALSHIGDVNPLHHLPHSVLGHHIPGTATGGIVTSPQVRLVGEAGPEAIIPLSKFGGSGGHVFNISVSTLDPRAAAPLIVEALQHYTDKNGSIPRVRIAG